MYSLLTDDIESMYHSFSKFNKSLYIVGGSVRSYIMSDNIHDIDFCTDATPDEMRAICKDIVQSGVDVSIIPTGERFGTLTFYFNNSGNLYEVTTFRNEGRYIDGRHPEDVTFSLSLAEDLSRRDFTCNAIAWSPSTDYIDPYNGIDDIHSGVIRCVGDPVERFNEDALRIIRLARFAMKYSFSIDNKTYIAASVLKDNISKISKERIGAELIQILDMDTANDGVMLKTLMLLTDILFVITHKSTREIHEALAQKTSLIKWYKLFSTGTSNSVELKKTLNSYAVGSYIVDPVIKIARAEAEINGYIKSNTIQFIPIAISSLNNQEIYSLSELFVNNEVVYNIIINFINSKYPCKLSDLCVDGNTVKQICGIAEGELVGKVLNNYLKDVVTHPEHNNVDYFKKNYACFL